MRFFSSRRRQRVTQETEGTEGAAAIDSADQTIAEEQLPETLPAEGGAPSLDAPCDLTPQATEALGPYSDGESPQGSQFLDLGALRIPLITGLQVFPVQDAHGNILAIEIVSAAAQMQLSPFAMQRSGGLWEEIREELAEQLKAQEYQIFPLPGPFGEAILARPIPGGKSCGEGAFPLLLWGIEGDRWFLRVIVRGQAAEDENARVGLLEVLHGMEVVRDDQAKVPGELLPIELPPEVADQLNAGEEAEQQ